MSSSQTVGVLTFHRCINHGSYWQARCLVDGIRGFGHEAVILDHDSPRVNYAEWRCALRPTLPTPVPPSDRPLYRAKMTKFSTTVAALPSSARFDLDDPGALEGYDTVVVGSDEVWNLHHPWYGGHPLFFGDGIDAPQLVSYAASFGNYTTAERLEDRWIDRLRRFSAISVRDDNSRDIIAASLGCRPTVVLDPCLQFPPELEGDWAGPDEPFVAVYGHNFSVTYAREIKRWAASRRLPLVSISYRNDWADVQWLDAGPHDFAHAIARSEAVATNFFHGCVFAVLNDKPFVCETTPYRSNKVRCLMSVISGERHLVSGQSPAAAYDDLLDEPLDPSIARAVGDLRATSSAYLHAALG